MAVFRHERVLFCFFAGVGNGGAISERMNVVCYWRFASHSDRTSLYQRTAVPISRGFHGLRDLNDRSFGYQRSLMSHCSAPPLEIQRPRPVAPLNDGSFDSPHTLFCTALRLHWEPPLCEGDDRKGDPRTRPPSHIDAHYQAEKIPSPFS